MNAGVVAVVERRQREEIIDQRGACVWFSGLPGAGKTTLSRMVEDRLHSQGFLTYRLDADEVRSTLNRDLGFTLEDREENLRRAALTAQTLVHSGVIVLAAFISPTEAARGQIAAILGDDLTTVFVDCPLEICMKRDPKGLYRRARAGEIDSVTGLDSPFDAPVTADVRVRSDREIPERCVDSIYQHLQNRGLLSRPSLSPDG